MSGPQEVSDELLYAYIDGELDAAAGARVAAAIEADPVLAQRVAQQRALRQLLSAQFDAVLEEPLPPRLLAAAAPPAAAVLDLAQARAQRDARTTRPAWQMWGAQAAALALGVLLGAVLFTRNGTQPFVQQGGELLASGALQSALSERLGEDAPADGVAIGLSIRTQDGQICRSFQLDAGQAGLACRNGDHWRVDMLTRASRSHDEYRQAGSGMPENLRLTIEARATGEPLTAEEEAIARKAGWHAD